MRWDGLRIVVGLGGMLALAALMAGTLVATPAMAKSPPDKLLVEGLGLNRGAVIIDEDISGFSPWDRGFIDWEGRVVTGPPPGDATYTVSFFLEERRIYVVEYVPDSAGGAGYVYVPGEGHPAFELNMSTISTGSSDRWNPNGKWQHTTAEWDSVIQDALAGNASPAGKATLNGDGSASADGSVATLGAAANAVLAAVAVVLAVGVVWIVLRRQASHSG